MPSFDIIGGIAIVEIPPGMGKKAREIGKELLARHKNLRAVYAKAGARKGVYRLRKLRFLCGKKGTITTHKESGCLFKVDVAKAYFSPRLSYERERIANLVQPGENVLALFAGVGPFPIVIARKQPHVGGIVAIELNPTAVKYMKENIRLNKLQTKIKPIGADVKKITKKYKNWADRVVMAYPDKAYAFLKEAYASAKDGATVHFYYFGNEKNAFDEAEKIANTAAKKATVMVEVENKRVVLPYAPRINQIVLDLRLRRHPTRSTSLLPQSVRPSSS